MSAADTAPQGLRVTKWDKRWTVVHVQSDRNMLTESVRLKRHAVMAMSEFYATGIDWTQDVDQLAKREDWRHGYGAVYDRWRTLVHNDYDPVSGEHVGYGRVIRSWP
jgi:hypothetical protein